MRNKRPSDNRLDGRHIHLEVFEHDFEVASSVKAVEEPVVKSYLAQLVPGVFDRIEFGCVGRLTQQSHIGWERILRARNCRPATVRHPITMCWSGWTCSTSLGNNHMQCVLKCDKDRVALDR